MAKDYFNQGVIDKAKIDYEAAKARGDEAGMQAAHDAAEAERAKLGFSGGATGDEHIPISTSGGGSSSKSSSSTPSVAQINPVTPKVQAQQSTPTISVPQLSGTESYYSKKKNGGKQNEDVRIIQNALISADGGKYASLLGKDGADGYYGINTANAILQYQKDHGLDQDGVAGVQTLTALGLLGSPVTPQSEIPPQQQQQQQPIQPTINPNVAGTPTTIWKASVDPNGNYIYNQMDGVISYDANGKESYLFGDGSGLQNGDAISDGNGNFLMYDPDVMGFVTQEKWEAKYNQQPSDMEQEELIDYLYSMLYDNFSSPVEMDDFLTWAEAQAMAHSVADPEYNAAAEQAQADIQNAALKSGFYGQLPTTAIEAQTAQTIENERNSTISNLALDLLADDRDAVLAKLNADIQAGKYSMDNIISLLELAVNFNQQGGDGDGTIKTNSISGLVGGVPSNGDTSTAGNGNSGNTGGTNNGGITNSGGTKRTSSSGNGSSTYDNGGLSNSQVRELQRALGLSGSDVDGYYGANTKRAAGGLDAKAAYAKYVTNGGRSGSGINNFVRDYESFVNANSGNGYVPTDFMNGGNRTVLGYSPADGSFTFGGVKYDSINKLANAMEAAELTESEFNKIASELDKYGFNVRQY